jgi:MFS family permease
LLQIPIGNLSDRLGFKFFIVCGYLLCALSGFLYFFADSAVLYFGGRFLQGIAEVPIWALAPALLSIQCASDKGKYMGLYNASLHCGLTTGGLFSIVSHRLWQGNEPFLLFAVMSILGMILTVLFVKNPCKLETDKMPAVNTKGIGALLSDPKNLVVFSGIAMYGAGYGIFLTIIPAFLISAKDAAQATIGFFFALFYIALSISQLFAGAWSDRNGRKAAMVFGLSITALGIAVFHGCPFPYFMGLLVLAGLGLGIFGVSSMAYLNERVPNSQKGTMSGTFYFFWGTGYFFGPLIVGKIGALFNFHAGFFIFSAMVILQLLAIGYFARRSHPITGQKILKGTIRHSGIRK